MAPLFFYCATQEAAPGFNLNRLYDPAASTQIFANKIP
jgi:hypothetical protein